ncbi:MAG: BON domain-containing protein [Betaproteobacteria bacterium]|nr:BON domain-containing protein [Betaproteobacteria bacterium]
MSVRSPLRIAALLLLAASTLTLQGCFTLAATGIGAAALAVDDRRPFGLYIEDENIEIKARVRLINDFKDGHVNVTSFNQLVMLTGEVPTEQAKKDVEAMVRGIPSVKNVANELAVAGNSSLVSRSGDSLTTTSVKARFLNNNKFSANHVKVVTEAGTVFLMGIVTREEGDAAAEIARNTSGVSRVVKVFEYVDQVPKR